MLTCSHCNASAHRSISGGSSAGRGVAGRSALFLRLVLGAGALGPSGGRVDERTGRPAGAPAVAGAEAGRLRLLSGRWRSTRLKEVGLRRDALAEEVSFGVRVERAAESSGSDDDDDDDDDGAAAPSSGTLRSFGRRAFFCLGGRGTAGRRPAGRVTTARSSRSFDVPWSATMERAMFETWWEGKRGTVSFMTCTC